MSNFSLIEESRLQKLHAANVILLLHAFIFQVIFLAQFFSVLFFFMNLLIYLAPIVANVVFLFSNEDYKFKLI